MASRAATSVSGPPKPPDLVTTITRAGCPVRPSGTPGSTSAIRSMRGQARTVAHRARGLAPGQQQAGRGLDRRGGGERERRRDPRRVLAAEVRRPRLQVQDRVAAPRQRGARLLRPPARRRPGPPRSRRSPAGRAAPASWRRARRRDAADDREHRAARAPHRPARGAPAPAGIPSNSAAASPAEPAHTTRRPAARPAAAIRARSASSTASQATMPGASRSSPDRTGRLVWLRSRSTRSASGRVAPARGTRAPRRRPPPPPRRARPRSPRRRGRAAASRASRTAAPRHAPPRASAHARSAALPSRVSRSIASTSAPPAGTPRSDTVARSPRRTACTPQSAAPGQVVGEDQRPHQLASGIGIASARPCRRGRSALGSRRAPRAARRRGPAARRPSRRSPHVPRAASSPAIKAATNAIHARLMTPSAATPSAPSSNRRTTHHAARPCSALP